jgi:hypothetical protein
MKMHFQDVVKISVILLHGLQLTHCGEKIVNPSSLPKYLLLSILLVASTFDIHAQVNGIGQKPYLGWSSFSQQTVSSGFLTQASMTVQSDAMVSSGLTSHGFTYINMDSGWQGSFDANGRPIPNLSIFPDIAGLAAHVHANGQKLGIYWIPGVEQPAVDANSPILGTTYHIKDILTVPYTAGNAFGGPGTSPFHYKIDFTKPGAQEYMNSVVALFASWGIDFIKLDGVTPGSYSDNLNIDNRNDVAAWSKAIAASGRPMWFTISWDLDQDYLSVWQQYANARRIDDDVECEGRCSTLTDWPRIYKRFRDLPAWQNAAGPTVGWNDMDSLDVINGATDGLTPDEKQSAITLWAIGNAPMSLGGDLTKLDATAKQLLSNDEVLAVNQSAKPARQVLGADTPVWLTNLGNDTYYVAIFNLNDAPASVTVPWKLLGFRVASRVRDLWNNNDLGPIPHSFTTVIAGHGARLLKVTGVGHVNAPASQIYEAEAALLSGSASISSCTPCSGGQKVGNLGLGANNTVTFTNVSVPTTGTYLMQVDSMTIGLRSYLFSVNGDKFQTINSGGSSFSIPSSTTIPIALKAGVNTIQFGNPTSYPPDLDRIIISGDGTAPLPAATTYEGEEATLTGGASGGFCNYCSGLSKAGNIGGTGTVTFNNVTVPVAGTYQLEIDYNTSGPRTFFLTVNDGAVTQLDLNGDTFDDPRATVIPVALNAGVNKLSFANPNSFAPDLDRISISPTVSSPELSGVLVPKRDIGNVALWDFNLTNNGAGVAMNARINNVGFTQIGGIQTCTAHSLLPAPFPLGNIQPGTTASIQLPIIFKQCGSDAVFSTIVTFSSNNGANVGTTPATIQPQ